MRVGRTMVSLRARRVSHKPAALIAFSSDPVGTIGWSRVEVSVAQNFLPCDRDQELLLPPSLREWLPEDHLVWFVLDSVAELDLDAFTRPIARTAGAPPRTTRR